MAPLPKASKSSEGGRGRGRGKRKSVVVETERTDNNTDSVSNVEKNVPPISKSTERRILHTDETQSEATFDSDDTQSTSNTRLLYPVIHLRQ